MRTIGVKELKANLSEVLREVDAGGHVRVTVRGTPVADLVRPLEDEREVRLRRLEAEGVVTRARNPSRSWEPWPEPVSLPYDSTKVISDDRDER